MYAEYKNIPVHRIEGCTQSMGSVHGVWKCINLCAEYKLMMNYDTESPLLDDDLYDIESPQPYPYATPLPFI